MKKLLSSLCAAALTASVAVTGVLPANAAPVFVPKAPTVEQSDVIQIQFRDRSPTAGDGAIWKKRRFSNRNNFRGSRNFRRNDWNRNWSRNWDDDNGWYRGHRGYRKYRRGYRYHDGFWFPAGAFIAGAIIGGAIANSNDGYYRGGGGSAHVQWCYDRYRSYRAYDNTFQPYNGLRRQCYSPYS